MSGTLKVGGVNLATHTGTDGTGNPVLDSGIVFPAGHVIQYHSIEQQIDVQVASEVEKVCDTSITLAQANSDLFIMLKTGIRNFSTSTYTDVDFSLAIGWKTGAASTTETDYTAIHSWDPNRESLTTLNAFKSQDTIGGTFNQNTDDVGHQCRANLGTIAEGTAINVALWASTENGSLYVGSSDSGLTDSGTLTVWNIMEIAG